MILYNKKWILLFSFFLVFSLDAFSGMSGLIIMPQRKTIAPKKKKPEVRVTNTSSIIEASTNTNIPKQLISDYNKSFNDTKYGDEKDWLGGKLFRIEEGWRFTDSLGIVAILPKLNPNFEKIVRESPIIAKEWSKLYGFGTDKKNLQPTNENIIGDSPLPSQLDGLLKLFESYDSQSAQIRLNEKKTRQEIQSNPSYIANVDCSSAATNNSFNDQLKSDCTHLLDLYNSHNTTMSYMNKLMQTINSLGKIIVSLSPEATKFKDKFSVIVLPKQKNDLGIPVDYCLGPEPISTLKPGEAYTCPAKYDCGKHGRGKLAALDPMFLAHYDIYSDSNCTQIRTKSRTILMPGIRNGSYKDLPDGHGIVPAGDANVLDLSDGCHPIGNVQNCPNNGCGFYKMNKPGQYEKAICVYFDHDEDYRIASPKQFGPPIYAQVAGDMQTQIIDEWSGRSQRKKELEANRSLPKVQCDGPSLTSLQPNSSYTCPASFDCGTGKVDFAKVHFTAKTYIFVGRECSSDQQYFKDNTGRVWSTPKPDANGMLYDGSSNTRVPYTTFNFVPLTGTTYTESLNVKGTVPQTGTGGFDIVNPNCQVNLSSGAPNSWKIVNPGQWENGICKYSGPVKKE